MLTIEQMGPNPKTTRLLSIITFLITIFAIAIVGLLVFPDNEPVNSFWKRGDFFWVKLLWCEVLFCFAWFFGLQFPFLNLLGQRQQTGGAILATSSVVVSNCAWSYFILFVSAFLPDGRQYSTFLIVAQIALIVNCFWQVMILSHARHLQNDGVIPISPSTKQPEALIAQLSISEKSIAAKDESLARSIKALYEKLNYSLPRVGKIASSSRYFSLANNIDLFCNSIDINSDLTEVRLELEKIDRELVLLIAELKS